MARPPGRLSGRGPCHPGGRAGGRAQKALAVAAAPWGSITLDLLGDGALKLSKLPDHWRCYKGPPICKLLLLLLTSGPGPQGGGGVEGAGMTAGVFVSLLKGRFSPPFMPNLCRRNSRSGWDDPPLRGNVPSLQINCVLSFCCVKGPNIII